MKRYCIYIVSNKSRRLYTGITSNLRKRFLPPKNKLLDGFQLSNFQLERRLAL